jgi:hypothetical protein
MTKVDVSVDFEQPATEVWAKLGDFTGIGEWFPGIEGCQSQKGGKRRLITLPDGNSVIEEEVGRDEAGMSMSYKVIEAPMPFKDYVSAISVAPRGEGCRADWIGDFTPIGDEDKVAKLVRRIYEVSLDALAAHLAENSK